jgi:hypothetical protein
MTFQEMALFWRFRGAQHVRKQGAGSTHTSQSSTTLAQEANSQEIKLNEIVKALGALARALESLGLAQAEDSGTHVADARQNFRIIRREP